MSEGKTFMRRGGNLVEFGDFALKLVAEVCGGTESYWLGTCETAVHRFLETRQVLLPTSSFDGKGKFLTSLRGGFSSGSGAGSFSLSGAVSQKDLAEYFQFLKEDYHLGTPRLCKLISHVGYQFNGNWFINEKVQFKNGKLVSEKERNFFCTDLQLKDYSLEVSGDLLQSNKQVTYVLNRFIELSAKAFGENQNAFLAATAFVGWRLMTNAIQEENGEANIGLIHSRDKSVGKTTALEIIAYAQGCMRKSHPLLMSLGNQCTSGTSLKMIMDKISKTTMVAFLDDGRMSSDLAEFLLQLQGGLSQGSNNTGTFAPKGSVLLTSNYKETERLTGRVITFPFVAVGGYRNEVEEAIGELSRLVCNNRGVLTLWAIKNLDAFKAIMKEVVPELANALAEEYPDKQARWHKGVAGVIASHALLLKSAGGKDSLSDVFETYLNLEEADSKIKCTLEKIQLCIFYQIEADPVPSKVLSWLNPGVQVNVGNKKLVPGIALNNTIIDEWSDVTRREIAVEAEKYGDKCVNVSLPFAADDNCDLSHLGKRTPELMKMSKGIKLPKKVLSPKLVTFIESLTGVDEQSNIEELRATVLQDIGPSEPRKAFRDTVIQDLESLEGRLNKIIEDEEKESEDTSVSTAMEFPQLMETLEAMSPGTKRQAEMFTPIRRKVFLEGYAKGMSRRSFLYDDSQDKEQPQTNTGTPCVPGAIGVLSTARKALNLEDAMQDSAGDSKDSDEDSTVCFMCEKRSPPSGFKGKTLRWIECDKCQKWFHLSCAGLKKEPPKKSQWFCACCKKEKTKGK